MDEDQLLDKYIKHFVTLALDQPIFATLTKMEYDQQALKLEEYFYKSAIDEMLNLLDDQQVIALQEAGLFSGEGLKLIEQFSSQIPGFLDKIEARLQKELVHIKNTQQLPN